MRIEVVLVAGSLLAYNAYAEEPTAAMAPVEAVAPSWKGEGELGYVASSGNSETRTMASKLKMSYESGPWASEVGLATLKASANVQIVDATTGQTSTEDQETADRWQLTGQSNYSVANYHYGFGSLRYEEDQYSGFAHQSTAAFGYGYHVLASDLHKLAIELGVGSRESEDLLTGVSTRETITRGHMTHAWQFSERAKWTNDYLIEAGADNTYQEFSTGLQIAINGSFALKLAYAWRHNSLVPVDRNNSDTVTTINLVFGF